MTEEQQSLLKLFKPPFRLDEHGSGFIFDADNQPVGEVRGWGRIESRGTPNAAAVQDLLGKMLADGLTNEFQQLLEK